MNPRMMQLDPIMSLTRSSIEKSILKGKDLAAARAAKMQEGQFLMEAAASLHNAARRLAGLQSVHNDRDRSALDQLSDTNAILEGSLVKLNEYVVSRTSSTASGVKKFVERAMPLLPVVAYLLLKTSHKA